MPVTYTNRKGVTYTLYRKIGAEGTSHFAFSRKSDSEPVDELPPGFRISESPNGRVSLAKDRPALIHAEELAAVETEIQRHPRAKNYRIASKQKRIEIYAKVGPDVVDLYHEMLAEGLALPGREKQMQEIDEQFAQFSPLLRFTLRDPAQRTFSAEQLTSHRGVDRWRDLGQTGSAAELAKSLVPTLGAEETYEYEKYFEPGLAAQSPSAPGGGRKHVSTSKRTPAQPSSVHQLKVTLMHLEPPIWRRIVAPSDVTLAELHAVIQLAMGWHFSHLHDFRVGRVTYGDPDMLVESGDKDERQAYLAEIAPKLKKRFQYLYDFGDSWEHEIVVEAVGPPEPGTRYPICLAGERACPPEDCGGVWGYADLLETLADPENPEREEMLDWLGGPIDPEAFNLKEVNRRLAQLR